MSTKAALICMSKKQLRRYVQRVAPRLPGVTRMNEPELYNIACWLLDRRH